MKKILIWASFLSVLIASLFYIKSRNEALTYKAVYPKTTTIYDVLTINGTVKEKAKKNLYVSENVFIDNLFVKVGDKVKKGDCIATIHKSDENEPLDVSGEFFKNIFFNSLGGDKIVFPLDTTYINSPIDGTVMAVNFYENKTANGLIPLFSISDLTDLEIVSQVNEEIISKLYEKLSAKITVPAVGDKSFDGVITDIMPYSIKSGGFINGKDNAAKTDVHISFNNENNQIRPGYSANAKIITDIRTNALTLPYEYIGQEQDGREYVYVLGKNALGEKRYIETGYELESETEIRSGLNYKDLVLSLEGKDSASAVKVRVVYEKN